MAAQLVVWQVSARLQEAGQGSITAVDVFPPHPPPPPPRVLQCSEGSCQAHDHIMNGIHSLLEVLVILMGRAKQFWH